MSRMLTFEAEPLKLFEESACGATCECSSCRGQSNTRFGDGTEADLLNEFDDVSGGRFETEETLFSESDGELTEAPAQQPTGKNPRTPIPCVEVTPEQLGFQNAGFLAEAVLHILYLRKHATAFFMGQVNVDTKLPGIKPKDLGAFLEVDREVAGEKT